jgi:lipopolysaccharide transport system ATP-binding protein
MTHPVVEARDATIAYSQGTSLFGRRRTVVAVRSLSFRIEAGDSLGIIGRNGSGKSTLLRAIAGIILPNSGTISVATTSVSLLALGVGFQPTLPAWDNVMMNGMLLGMSRRRMLELAPQIFEFAELQSFRDAPLKTFSSGMRSRLAFATAIHAQPELLLIDEVLSVGDKDFSKKSKQIIEERFRSGQTNVLVTHNTGAIRELCNRALWIEHGELQADGPAGDVVKEYLAS